MNTKTKTYNAYNDNDSQIIDPDQVNMDMQSQSISGSNTASSSTMSETVKKKQQLDEKAMPSQLINLKKAIYMFFFILIATSFSVLIINQY